MIDYNTILIFYHAIIALMFVGGIICWSDNKTKKIIKMKKVKSKIGEYSFILAFLELLTMLFKYSNGFSTPVMLETLLISIFASIFYIMIYFFSVFLLFYLVENNKVEKLRITEEKRKTEQKRERLKQEIKKLSKDEKEIFKRIKREEISKHKYAKNDEDDENDENDEDEKNVKNNEDINRVVMDKTKSEIMIKNEANEKALIEAKYEAKQIKKGLVKFISKEGLYESWVKPNELKRLKEIDIGLSDNFESMHHFDFEKFIARLLEKMNYKNVKITSKTGDYGVDIICKKGQSKIIVEVKKYQGSISNNVVRSILGAMGKFEATRSIIITSGTFTKQAREQARGQPIELWDKNILHKLVRKHMIHGNVQLKLQDDIQEDDEEEEEESTNIGGMSSWGQEFFRK